ncbi:hypothetical protein VB776_15715 [Arcicella sp. DC2W]|uniref:DUF4136 domain-containing protein n=1 Tax=Arcicella gelida TaxID=2984195 RepID=A0ABU5S7C9_9BACT|nr:hypothetical protein [Arcicella sp. DC2W]MEA5404380.1 hypothetical protein [Arcicella sp. DC2W]
MKIIVLNILFLGISFYQTGWTNSNLLFRDNIIVGINHNDIFENTDSTSEVFKGYNKLRHFLGTNASKTIIQAEQVTPFLLYPFKHDGDTFAGYTVRKKGVSLTQNEVISLKEIICSDRNYAFDNLMKNCTFTPILGLEFKKGTQIVQVLICLDCDVWRFVGNDLNKEEDFDVAHGLIINYLRQMFPTDTIVKQIH